MIYTIVLVLLQISPIKPPNAPAIKRKKISNKLIDNSGFSCNGNAISFSTVIIAIIFKPAIKIPKNHPFFFIMHPTKKLPSNVDMNFDTSGGVMLVNIIPEMNVIKKPSSIVVIFFIF